MKTVYMERFYGCVFYANLGGNLLEEVQRNKDFGPVCTTEHSIEELKEHALSEYTGRRYNKNNEYSNKEIADTHRDCRIDSFGHKLLGDSDLSHFVSIDASYEVAYIGQHFRDRENITIETERKWFEELFRYLKLFGVDADQADIGWHTVISHC